jgi:DNA-directed RNA polymerase I, II, and III subunit RPABC2
MSDNEYYSNSDSENSDKEDSDNEETLISSSKKPLFKPSINIKKITDEKDSDVDDSEPDDAESEEDDEEDVQVGGVADFPDEDEYVKNVDDDEDDSDIELNEDGEPIEKVAVTASKNTKPKKTQMIVDEDEDEDDEYDENYLQKFDNEIIKNYVNEFHPECLNHNYDEITKLSVIVRNPDGIIIDPLHRTIPYLTKYEKARVLGQRAKQIETGAKPLVKVPENIVDSYIIAELELREKKIPFIIRRPIPGGGCEYWNLKDLEQIAF